jgi:hypothetical protein
MYQQIKKAIIKRWIKKSQVEVESIGGSSKADFISPNGLYSKPLNRNSLMLQIINDEGNKVVIPLQKFPDFLTLEDNDVLLTDDKSYIHFDNKNGNILVKLTKLKIENDTGELIAFLVDQIDELIIQAQAISDITVITSLGTQPIVNKASFVTIKSNLETLKATIDSFKV